jgi:hypothetical protein
VGNDSPERSWKPFIAVAAALALAAGAFLAGLWAGSPREICVMSPSGTMVCGPASGPAGAAARLGSPVVVPQGEGYREGRKKVTESRCGKDEEGVQVCRTTEYYE